MDVTNAWPGRAEDPTVLGHMRALWRACRPWGVRLTLLVGCGLAILGWLVKHRAEHNLLCVFLSYLPVWVMVLPLLATLAAGFLFLCWRTMLISLLMSAWIILWVGGYRLSSGRPASVEPAVDTLSVMTYNRGQGSGKVLTAFTEERRPDVAVFQDAARRLPQLMALSQFARHRHTSQDGEFLLLSRWPVVESGLVQLTWPGDSSGFARAGTRSVIDWNGRRVVVYNIHLPTPRDLLYWYGRRGTFLYGVLGLVPHTPLYARHQLYLDTWRARVSLVSQLVSRVRAEQNPVLLLGDLNLPPAGLGYQQLCDVLKDAHEAAGTGFGHTFPANKTSLARLFAPWLRIDYAFASADWEVLSCDVSRQEGAQHLPLGVLLKLR